uniref:Uncharacterized protein n=1 Tax=Ananas comosus var. bracteatus TaxID=296719 RepID=A0A6V7NW56_ANACO|nr:unnamed protein product [Ananas comosus var. bracteatus]
MANIGREQRRRRRRRRRRRSALVLSGTSLSSPAHPPPSSPLIPPRPRCDILFFPPLRPSSTASDDDAYLTFSRHSRPFPLPAPSPPSPLSTTTPFRRHRRSEGRCGAAASERGVFSGVVAGAMTVGGEAPPAWVEVSSSAEVAYDLTPLRTSRRIATCSRREIRSASSHGADRATALL